ncbi:efflux RND transporter periplasmic adaptor subunit [Cytobacillus kochii]|uniref:efflux RND transporter periplasmic adaptor subunit n=1 Tax=Cytobacillus kochii TaxID=859143 RepID=UPI001CD54F6A|nr:efflux RND transporter periplasmic adaptor subunit [Cytobacillus kochii]MCA1026311.1 efflux RND transporter periplasmic adaptor subunit [Cytobacillus kochii]
MKLKWKLLIAAVITLFIALNITLIFTSEKEINRVNYISKWTVANEQDLIETLPVAGMFMPKEEQFFYHDQDKGSFQGFLVEKGQAVEPGTAVLEYSPQNINETKSAFQMEIDRLNQEVASLDQHISQMEQLLATSNTMPASSTGTSQNQQLQTPNDDSIIVQVEPFDSTAYIQQSIARDIENKELDKSKLESEIEKYEEMLTAADSSMIELTAESMISGTVKELKHTLENPILTIISNEQKIEGELTEDEVQQILPGMKVLITYENSNKQLEGTIDTVSVYPEETPEIGKENSYLYTVQLTEPEDGTSVFGQHVNVKIVTNEVQGATTVPVKTIKHTDKKQVSYILGAGGYVERRQLDTGMKLDHTVEVQKGVEAGELIVLDRPLLIKSNHPFITPLSPTKNTKASYGAMSGMEIFKTISKGFLSR